MTDEERREFFRLCGQRGAIASRQNVRTKLCVSCERVLSTTNFYKSERIKAEPTCKKCRPRQLDSNDVRVVLWTNAYSRAIKNNIAFTITIDDIVVPDVCPVLGVPFERGHSKWTYSLDKVRPSEGYVPGNVAVISNEANRLKSYMTDETIENMLRYVRSSR